MSKRKAAQRAAFPTRDIDGGELNVTSVIGNLGLAISLDPNRLHLARWVVSLMSGPENEADRKA